MASTHFKSKPTTPQALRQSIVGYVPDTYRYPQIKLKGKWLEQAGFTTGTPLTVRVMDGCLVITSQPSLMDNAANVSANDKRP
ncbi:SymE family type I addiction module toxin [Candidatus Regiella endosymbiont of Tuberolachnus salignus]|uniref:SymE family type I addiction module toxin n=1 Tax=Candidatus Regiella endosymbiont of Tuberolachnus salignus TaxID=3077956 RepID=UPI003BAF8900